MSWDCCSICARYGSGACDMSLPMPICELGFPDSQLREIFSEEKLKEFFKWMTGQTVGICDGRSYDHEDREYKPTGCGPHGAAYYFWDVKRFLDGRPIID